MHSVSHERINGDDEYLQQYAPVKRPVFEVNRLRCVIGNRLSRNRIAFVEQVKYSYHEIVSNPNNTTYRDLVVDDSSVVDSGHQIFKVPMREYG